ncbi:MAG: hypothetical protein GC202_02015 [Alphaproteobacteria bacterium]|nr:hypothetical protein [Alphaproteobacteria bacterium]
MDDIASALSIVAHGFGVLGLLAVAVGLLFFSKAHNIGSAIGCAAVIVVGVAISWTAWGAPPAEGELRFSDWYQSLRVPGIPDDEPQQSCCDLSDCRPIERTRIGPEGYEALITPKTHSQFGITEPTWVKVPNEAILQTTRNPDGTGRAVVCWMPTRGVICFVRPLEI